MERMEFGLRELKFSGSDPAAMEFDGYGAVFGNMDARGDVIQKGAFAKTLAEAKASGDWPAMLEQHGTMGGLINGNDTPIGVWTSIEEDDTGLLVRGKLAPTPRGQEMHALMKMQPRPAINGLSIGFKTIDYTMRTKPEEPRRTLKQIQLFEISPVTFPANGKARVTSVKSLEMVSTIADVEDILRDAGFSRAEAKALVAKIKSASPREAGGDDVKDVVERIKRNTAILQTA